MQRPVGAVDNRACYHYMNLTGTLESYQLGAHQNTALLAIHAGNDLARRPGAAVTREKILKTLELNGFQNQQLPPEKYFQTLPSYKYVFSPEGNGLDCHRHYESLWAGCIPVIEANPTIEQKYHGCPLLTTLDYSEISEQYLLQHYQSALNREYDFSTLLFSSQPKEYQQQIIENGNYWGSRLLSKKWYQ
jgi:hypothetical protein